MMMKLKASVLILTVWLVFAGTAFAQDPRPTPTTIPPTGNTGTDTAPANGSIRGTVYEDVNFDGKCGVGDAVIAGIPIRFTSSGGDAIYLQSGENGTYGLVAVGFGTWEVSAEPPAGWVVSSTDPIAVTLVNEDGRKVALGVDFCLANAGSGGGATLLPEAGAPIAPALIALLLGGLLLAGVGAAMGKRREEV
ncbi:MAG: hypothetical protein KC418_19085 [Anaerolineales bacterium]|nr:hypothetical protein [Anaerolineales bacterium]MCB8952254.1 hypothetical protein [Ardenticatenales bacterium]